MFDNPRDAMAIALMYLGYSVNTTNTDELNAAYNLLLQQNLSSRPMSWIRSSISLKAAKRHPAVLCRRLSDDA